MTEDRFRTRDSMPSAVLWCALAEIARHPTQVFIGTFDFAHSWLSSRSWLSIVLFVVPLATALTLVFIDKLPLAEPRWLNHGLERVENEIESARLDVLTSEHEQDVYSSEEHVDFESELILRRLLAEDEVNVRARYLLAIRFTSEGRLGVARFLMRSIAPERDAGYPKAHAWLAQDRLRHIGAGTPGEIEILVRDLSVATSEEDASPKLLVRYADVLARQGKTEEALNALKRAALRVPTIWSRYAAVAKLSGLQEPYEMAKQALHSKSGLLIESGAGSEEDYLAVLEIARLEKDFESLVTVGTAAVDRFPSSSRLKRALSTGYVLKYRHLYDKDDGRIELALLEAAIAADRTNPSITEEIAWLVTNGISSSENLLATLESNLADVVVSPVTRQLLANVYVERGDYLNALAQLELAVKSAPNSPQLLNNWAYCLVQAHPDDPAKLRQAEEILRYAIALTDDNEQLYDTMVRIFLDAEQYANAIRWLESSLQAHPGRRTTLENMVVAYKALELYELSELFEAQLADLQSANSD